MDKEKICFISDLIKSQKELLLEKDDILSELYDLCDDEEQRNLVKQLLVNFSLMDEDVYNLCLLEMSNYIVNRGYPLNECLLVATAHDHLPDSSQGVLQDIKFFMELKHFPSDNYCNRFERCFKKRDFPSIRHFFILDDFVGSGSTLLNRKEEFESKMAQNGREYSLHFVVASGMRFAVEGLLVMQGDHLRFPTDGIDSLLDKCTYEIVETGDNKQKNSLQNDYQQLLIELKSAIMLTKFYIYITSEIYEKRVSRKRILNFIEVDKPSSKRDSWLTLLDTIIDIWLFEYRFSYDQIKIRDLLICKEHLEKAKGNIVDSDAKKNVDLAISEIDILLLKLSHFAKNMRIEYQFNLKNSVVAPKGIDTSANDVYSNFLKFINPEKYILEEDVYQWQSHPNKRWAKLGQMVLLMRYYTKVTKNVTQAENLLKEYELFYEDKEKTMFYEFNKYALRSVRVYMYNCLFSLKCKYPKIFSFKDIRICLDKIITIQNMCMIYNYHPYQKAIEYTIKSIKEDIVNRVDKSILIEKMDCVKQWNEFFHDKIEWSKQNQCYAFQLTFNECTEINNEYRLFHPSSFSRPLKFDDIFKKRDQLDWECSMLESEIERYEDILSIQEAQKKISNMERKNMEQMGLFITITTFLVGLLSIFIGNNAKVSIIEKMRYVVALGCILIVFVCLGYFAVKDKYDKAKCWLFGILIILSSLSILFICK